MLERDSGGRTNTSVRTGDRARVPERPVGKDKARWIGPGVLWALAALATGELLFTPRIGALYGYTLVWAMIVALGLKLVVTREIGRYSVATGRGLLTGFASLPGPRRWAVWVIVVPQLVVAVAALAGIARAAGSALSLAVPLSVGLLGSAVLVVSGTLVLVGHYAGVEWVARVIGLLLALGSILAAVLVGPDVAALTRGVVPGLPDKVKVADVLPWLGFLSNGAAGLMWYSYWVRAKKVGVAGARKPIKDVHELSQEDVARVRGWLRTMTLDSSLAVLGVALITVAFLILGAELLRPAGIVPAEDDVAADLTTLFDKVFGQWGRWFMIVGIFSAFFTAVLTYQDGWKRMHVDGIRRLVDGTSASRRQWLQPDRLGTVLLVGLLGVIPLAVLAIVGNPVTLLTLAGSIEAVHIPVVAALTWWVNRRELPTSLRPGRVGKGLLVLTVVFFGSFAVGYLIQQVA